MRRRDRVTVPPDRRPSIDLSPLCGVWINTETRSTWLSRIEVRDERGTLIVHPFGGLGGSPHDWGEGRAEMVCATGVTSHEGGGFVANLSLELLDAQLQANLSQGLLIVATFSHIRDGASVRGRVTREYFRPAHRGSQ